MTPLRKHAILRRVKDITIGTTLSIALLNGSVLLQSCGTNQQEQTTQNGQTQTAFREGVLTYVTETSPGNFRITDEVQADPSRAGAIVNYHDGHRDTLSVEAAKRLVQNDPSTSQYFNNPSSYGTHHGSGLANVLLWGSLGYMLGRSMTPRYGYEQRFQSGAYANPNVYNKSTQLSERVRSSRVSRPAGGRSGFFGGNRSSSSRGYSS
ncbi:hypothetical protein GCM10023189_49030 [Nibrella saemangeumensis]|uniref:UPF0323 domain-containing protein n=1 Tax=Nibrella saemangeumensis TaxID=1084526 RepID=A0ABP8NFT7_9BACT